MRRLTVALAVVGVSLLAVGCSGSNQGTTTTTTTTTSTTKNAPPISEGVLKGLLLSPEQVNAVMGVAEMTVTGSRTGMSDDSATMEPRECLAVDGSAQALVYADSGFIAMRDQTFQLQEDNNFTHFAEQAVVLFPSAKQADAFFAASAKEWPTCHQYRHTQSGTKWETGAVSNNKGMLSTIATQQDAGSKGWACGRALAIRNNVVIDVNTCSADPGDSAVALATQIADKIPTK